jgi:hypothetical protein
MEDEEEDKEQMEGRKNEVKALGQYLILSNA